MNSSFFNRRMLMGRLVAGLSAVGVGSLLAGRAEAKTRDSGVRKLVLKAKASAASYGMSSTAEVAGLLSLMLVLQDEDFETRDANEWMLAILRSPSIPGAQKFRMILQQQLESI